MFYLIGSITVNKSKVQLHIREDANKLYNYIIRLAVLPVIKDQPFVNLIRDNKSVKVKSGNCLIDYLQTELWFELHSRTKVVDIPSDSKLGTRPVTCGINIVFNFLSSVGLGVYSDDKAKKNAEAAAKAAQAAKKEKETGAAERKKPVGSAFT